VTTVSELLSENGQWNEEVIKQTFFPVDAAAIMRTTARSQWEDVWAWEPKKHGLYSVRSAYRLLDSARIRDYDEQTASGSGSSCRQKIWKLKVPPKIKVFWWRVLHEFLPARQVLHRKHIEPIANCEVCGAESESIRHVLIDCTVARAFWDQTKATTGVKLPSLHHETWAQDLLEGRASSVQNQTTFIIGMYVLRTGNRLGV